MISKINFQKMGLFNYEYLGPKILTGFDSYKYSSKDTSPLSQYVMHPFWNQVGSRDSWFFLPHGGGLPWDLQYCTCTLHNDPAAHPDHYGRCRDRRAASTVWRTTNEPPHLPFINPLRTVKKNFSNKSEKFTHFKSVEIFVLSLLFTKIL